MYIGHKNCSVVMWLFFSEPTDNSKTAAETSTIFGAHAHNRILNGSMFISGPSCVAAACSYS